MHKRNMTTTKANASKRLAQCLSRCAVIAFFGIFIGAVAASSGTPSVVSATFEQANSNEPTVSFSAAALLSSQPGSVVSFALGNSLSVRLVTDRLVAGSGGGTTWVGYDPNTGRSVRSYVSVLGDDVAGEVSVGSARYRLSRVPDSSGLLKVLDMEKASMSRAFSARPDYLRVDPDARRRAGVESLPVESDEAKAVPTPQTTIDLAVVFTTGMVTRYGSVSGVVNRINQLVTAANDAYANSEVAITLRLVKTEQVSYPDTGDNGDALNAFSGFQASPTFGEISPLPALAATVRPIRNATGADIMVLLRPFSVATHGGCGIAWLGDGNSNVAFDSQFGYAVVSDGSDGSYFCAVDSFAHEVGHNMGLTHDRPNAAGEGATFFSYGYGLNYNGPTANLGDIMSYASNRVPFFSSPNLRCNTANRTCALGGAGTPLGVAGDSDFGTCTTNPGTCADAARTLNVTRAYIASFRASVGASISGTITNGASPLAGVTFCARPATGVTCAASSGAGAYSCTLPNGWSGLLHAPGPAGLRIKPQSFTNVTGNLTGQNPVVQSIGACNLDVDNNGLIEPATDGVAILRRLLGTTSGGFAGLAGACAANTTSTAIFNATASNYNATGGALTRPGTDGLVILRAMQGLTGTAVTNGLGLAAEAGATNTTWATIRNNFLNSTCGADFLP